MKKYLSLLVLMLLSLCTTAWAENVTYALSAGETHASGDAVDVKSGDTKVATLTFGVSGGAAFSAAVANSGISGFTAYTGGNGTNGSADGGTLYIIEPVYDGTIEVGVYLNVNKAFFVLEDGSALADYNGIKKDAKYTGTFSFDVKAGKTYKVYSAGSKLGFYGFKYTYTTSGSGSGGGGAATTVYSWDKSSGTVAQTGGTLTGSESVQATVAGSINALTVSGKAANLVPDDASAVTIHLTEALKAGDVIKVTGFQNKNLDGKVVTLHIGYFDGTTKKAETKDDKNWVNLNTTAGLTVGTEPETKEFTVPAEAAGFKTIVFTRNLAATNLFISKIEITSGTPVAERKEITFDFQELCMKLGKGGPWPVNDGGDAGFKIGEGDGAATMHYLGDYNEQGFTWKKKIAYEYVEKDGKNRGKFTFRNKSNKKDKDCGMFSWNHAHYVSLVGLQDGDEVTITYPTGTVNFASDNLDGATVGSKITSGTKYTVKTTDASTNVTFQMAKASLISKIVIKTVLPVAPYQVKYVDGTGAELKAAKNYDADIDSKVTASAEDIRSFMVGTTKWVFTESDTITVVDEAVVTKNIVTAKFHEAQNVNYSVVAKCGKVEYVLESGNQEEGEFMMTYPQYVVVDGTSYKAAIDKTTKTYQTELLLNKADQKLEIAYTKHKDNVEILTEPETAAGISTFANANCSGGQAAYSTDDFVKITDKVLTPGKYQMVISMCNATGANANGYWFVFNAVPRGSVLPTEEALRLSMEKDKKDIQEYTKDIEIHTPAYIYMKGGANNIGIDNILFIRSGDLDAAKGYVNLVDSIQKDSLEALTEMYTIHAKEYDVYLSPSKLAVVNDTTYLNMKNGTISIQCTTGKAVKQVEFVYVVDSCWNYITADLGTIEGKKWTMKEGFDKVIFTFTTDVFIGGISVGGAAIPKPTPVGEKGTATYALAEGETHKSGESVDVKNEKGDVVGTLTFGESGGNDFKAAAKNTAVDGYTAFTEGNGTNGNAAGGTFYVFTPKHDGTASAAVVLNANKEFFIMENGTALEAYNGIKESEKVSKAYSFDVKGGSTYKIYCSGSKLGFYGLTYNYQAAVTPTGTETTAKVTYNGTEESDPEGFFTHDADGKFSFNNKFKDASYDGIDFANGLKMEGTTKITFTTPAEATITIVQSTWSDKTLKLDGTELAVADAAEGTGCRIYTIKNVAAGDHTVTRGSGESGIFMIKATYTQAAPVVGGGSADFDFQELCMKLGKFSPVAVNDGGDAGFTVNEAEMHYIGDYPDQEFAWNNRLAYEYVADRGKFTFRNKNGKKDSACGLFSWDYAHYASILNLGDGDKVTINIPTGTVKFVSDNVEGVSAGDAVESGKTYTIKATDGPAHLDIQMDKSTLIGRITIEALGVETVPTIQMSKSTLALVPGATSILTAVVTPASSVVTWQTSNEKVATIAEDGTVTAVAAGTAEISCVWKSETSDKLVEAKCVVTVADVDLTTMKVEKTYDFAAMEDTELTTQEEAAGSIWNAANSKNNNVFYCTNEGLELIAIQAALSGGKGWSIVGGKGLELASGAGRCAAVGGIKNGQIVEILYTGNNFYTSDSDDGVSKVALNEGTGRAIYQATEDGMLGFELVKGNDVQKIIIYEGSATVGINDVKNVFDNGAVYNLNGQKVADSLQGLKPGLYIVDGVKVVVK